VIGTINALLPTALQFGAVNALVIKYGMTLKLWSFVAGHGVLEFTSIFIAGGAGLMIGLAVIAPGERTRREALLEKGSLAIKLLAGSIPMLVIAGCIEAFISPAHIHPAYKFGVSAATAVGLAAYLLKAERGKPGASGQEISKAEGPRRISQSAAPANSAANI
jgi:Stage II sporulation protein M